MHGENSVEKYSVGKNSVENRTEGEGRSAELLAPAGNEAGFYGAISAGADAVYLGGSRFGARAYAENFTEESLIKCIRYAHLFGRKVYLTVNTLFKEPELEELDGYLEPLCEAGLDAAIVQDIGVLRHVRERFPGLSLHVSTQMTLCGVDGAALLKAMGADRIVPARELSLEELVKIRRTSDIEVETFIHGAMCYCYSGQCLFSSILGGRSGNRGRCAQPCRLPYGVEGIPSKLPPECYPLSLKDMCTIEHIPLLTEAGIDSFKIEGRMKRPEYAAGVTSVYRKYMDLYARLREMLPPGEAGEAYRQELKEERSGADRRLLSTLYVRSGLQDGYYFRQGGREMVTVESPAYGGADDAMLVEIAERYLREPPRLPVTAEAVFTTGEPARVTLRCGEISAVAVGGAVQEAKSRPVTRENIEKQLGKLGDSPFCADRLQVSVSEDAFYPLGQINELRRQAAEELERRLLSENAGGCGRPAGGERRGDRCGAFPEKPGRDTSARDSRACEKPVRDGRAADGGEKKPGGTAEADWAVSVRTLEQLRAVSRWVDENKALSPGRIYVDGDLAVGEREEVLRLRGTLPEKAGVWAALPCILRESDREYLERLCLAAKSGGFRGFLARSMDGLGFLLERGTGLGLRTDAGLYCWNSEALRELRELGASGGCLPYELNGAEQKALLKEAEAACFPLEKIVYGRIPMMVAANCVTRTASGCRKGRGAQAVLTDRYKKKFPVLRNCEHCFNIIYNSVPLSLKNELTKWRGVEKRLDFTLEDTFETEAVLQCFFGDGAFPFRDYTTGHEKRGVE